MTWTKKPRSGIIATSAGWRASIKEQRNESILFSEEALREMQDRAAKRYRIRYMRKPKAQAATGMMTYGTY
jgi:hypothetical protein